MCRAIDFLFGTLDEDNRILATSIGPSGDLAVP